MFKVIYESENWTVREDEKGNLSIAYFEDYHWRGEIHIDQDGIREE